MTPFVSLLSLAACELSGDICIGDCDDSGAESSVSHSTTAHPGTVSVTTDAATDGADSDSAGTVVSDTDGAPDETTDGEPGGVCAIEDNLAVPPNCMNDDALPGEFCFSIGAGGPIYPQPILSAVVGDLDGLGGLDVLVSHPDDSLSVSLDGPAPFLDMSGGTWSYDAPAGELILTATGDFNDDGHVDAAGRRVGGPDELVELLFLDGTGGLLAAAQLSLGTVVWGPEIVDWDGDGDPDLLVAAAGDPGFTDVLVLENEGGSLSIAPQFSSDVAAIAAATGALGADGARNDFVLAGPDGALDVHFGGPEGISGLTVAVGQDVVVRALEIADLNDDSRGDIAALVEDPATGGTSAVILLQSGAAERPAFSSASYPVRCGATSLAFGDLDQDGAPDLVAGGPGGGAADVTLRRNDGQGGFPQVLTLAVGPADESYAEDFNGDGTIDLGLIDRTGGGLTYMPNTP